MKISLLVFELWGNNTRTDRHTDIHTDIQTYRQTDRQTELKYYISKNLRNAKMPENEQCNNSKLHVFCCMSGEKNTVHTFLKETQSRQTSTFHTIFLSKVRKHFVIWDHSWFQWKMTFFRFEILLLFCHYDILKDISAFIWSKYLNYWPSELEG